MTTQDIFNEFKSRYINTEHSLEELYPKMSPDLRTFLSFIKNNKDVKLTYEPDHSSNNSVFIRVETDSQDFAHHGIQNVMFRYTYKI